MSQDSDTPATNGNGHEYRVGDWVTVVGIPLGIQNVPDVLKDFHDAIGKSFEIQAIDQYRMLELWVTETGPLLNIEPELVIAVDSKE